MIMWKGSTSATIARKYRDICLCYAEEAGEKNFSFVDWQCHDFSMRGMSGLEDAILSGMGHLLCFSGTDCIPAIFAAKKYYGADFNVGGSVPATEHSVMCAGSLEGEVDTFRRLLTEVYPTGILSVVSDTWDLWKVLTEYVPQLKSEILNRDGKLVIRPDSGDPEKIICGDYEYLNVVNTYLGSPHDKHPALFGTLALLQYALGTTNKMINNAGAIYGDSITPERCDSILKRIVRELNLSPYNMVFGVGSYTYEYVTRDTCGFAMKETAVMRNSKWINVYKKPVTDNGGKFSHKGIVTVWRDEDNSTQDNPRYFFQQESKIEDLDNCAFQLYFENGKRLINDDFMMLRKRMRSEE